MRIGFLGPFCTSFNSDYGSERQVGAIEQQFFGIAKELTDRGHEVVIARNWTGSQKESIVNGVRLLNVNSFDQSGHGFSDSRFPCNRLSHLSYLLNAPKKLAKSNLDVICTAGILQSWVFSRVTRKSDAKRVFIAINNDVFIEKGVGHTHTPHITRTMFQSVNKDYHTTVAITKGLRGYMEGIGMKCDLVIPCAVDPGKYSCRDDADFILTAARLVPHKRIEQLIQAYHEILHETDQNLVVIGSGPCEHALKQLAAARSIGDRVVFLPFLPQSEYRDRLSRCSFFVLPSEAETFGVVVLESMACGKPVVARNTIGPRDTITDKHDGFLFSNLDELKAQMKLLLKNESMRLIMGRRARENVERGYSFSYVAAQYEGLFESIV